MQPTPGATRTPLPPAVEAALAQLERRLRQAAEAPARRGLAELGEAAALRVLRKIGASQREVRTLTGYINYMAAKEALERNADGVDTAESVACKPSAPCSGGPPRLLFACPVSFACIGIAPRFWIFFCAFRGGACLVTFGRNMGRLGSDFHAFSNWNMEYFSLRSFSVISRTLFLLFPQHVWLPIFK